MTADEINRSFPNIADWIQGSGWIEIGNQEWQGFVVRALAEGGEVIEVEQCKSFGEDSDRTGGRDPQGGLLNQMSG